MTRVYLVRHAVHGLVDKRLAGRLPAIHLSEDGRVQADAVALHFQGMAAVRLLSSPLARRRETAEPVALALGLPILVDERLNELDCGVWTGLDFDTLAEDPRWRAWNSERVANGVPGGETIEAVRTRVMAALGDLAAEQPGPVIVVSHGDVIKVSVLTLLGRGRETFRRGLFRRGHARHGRHRARPKDPATLS